MERPPLHYGRQIDEDDVQEVVECLRSDWLTQGPRVTSFEAGLAAATGARYAVAACNGTAALHLAALALGVREGDVGVVPAVTFVASANCVVYSGGSVEFADVEPDTGLMSPSTLEAAVAKLATRGVKPKVVVPVDLTGQPADWAGIRRVAESCGARVLLDAAHSLGARALVNGHLRRVGESGYADATVLSFHPVKHVTSAEGGAILTNDATIWQELVALRSFGIHKDPARFRRPTSDPFVGPWYYETESLGFNYRLSDVHCALGLSQLRKLDRFVARRRELARRYDAALASNPLCRHLRPLKQHAGRETSYHLYVAQLVEEGDPREVAAARLDLFGFLASRGIHCQVHYVPVPWQPYYQARGAGGEDAYPGALRYYVSSLSLPLFPAMTDADVDRVIEALQAWVKLRTRRDASG